MDKKQFDFELTIERIKKQFLYKSDKELSNAIGMTPTAFNNRKKTASLPYPEIIDFANTRNVNLNWILTGDGPIYKDDRPGSENDVAQDTGPEKKPAHSNITQVIIEHQDMIRKFQNSEKAMEFNHYLVEIEKQDPEGYEELYREARSIYKTLRRIQQKEDSKKTANSDEDYNQNGKSA